jgi:hypothetical protein
VVVVARLPGRPGLSNALPRHLFTVRLFTFNARDIKFVRTLCRAMRGYHLRVWIDRDELTVG